MKIFLQVLLSTVLLMPVAFLLWVAHPNAEATGNTFMEIQKITRSADVSTLQVFEDKLITTYRDYANQPALISSYSKTGFLNWEISASGPHAIAENKFARVERSILYVHSTATGEVLTTVKFPYAVSKIYMNEFFIVIASQSYFYVYDTNGNYIMNGNADVFKGGALSKNLLILQDSKGVHTFNLSIRKKIWQVPLEARFNNERLLLPVDNVVYAQGVEQLSQTDPLLTKDVLLAINAGTGAVIYKKDFGKYEDSYARIKEFGLFISHPAEDVHKIYHPDGTLKLELNMESAAIKQLKEKNFIYGIYYNGAEDYVASNEGIYYFKKYIGVYNEFLFSSLKIVDNTGAVKFEKVFEDEHVFSIATTDSNKLFVANGNALGNSSETNELNVYDSNGTLLDTIETEYIGKLKSDGTNLYGYGGRALYIFKESEPKESTAVHRIFGSSRFETAIAISREGWQTAETVVLATAADFPDALAGGPLAYKENAPILLTRSERLLLDTKDEINRLGAKKVIILGSYAAVSLEVEKELRVMGLEVDRIGGKNRFETAALIAQRLNSTEAVVAFGFNFPDALSVSAYAAKNGIPILLTRSDKLPAETDAALKSKSKTHVIGSTSAVGEAVFNALPNPVRYGGNTRYDTGLEVNTKLKMGTGKAFIATGMNFPDALAGSVLAAKNDAPILLVKEETIPEATAKQLTGYESYTILGGLGAVGETVRDRLSKQLNN